MPLVMAHCHLHYSPYTTDEPGIMICEPLFSPVYGAFRAAVLGPPFRRCAKITSALRLAGMRMNRVVQFGIHSTSFQTNLASFLLGRPFRFVFFAIQIGAATKAFFRMRRPNVFQHRFI